MCYIAPGQTGACDRYGNVGGRIVRSDPLTVLDRATRRGGAVVPFAAGDWDGEIARPPEGFVTGIGAGTTYPDYKPAPFIVAREVEGADVVTVVTEAIFSYCGAKVKIDTDRYLGPERAVVRADGEAIGHVTTAEYGSQMLSLGGVDHLTGGSKAEGRATCAALLGLCNREPRGARHRGRRHRHRSRPAARPWSTAPPSGGCASAAARPPSACSPRSGAASSTRWSSSTTTSPASSPSTRPAGCSAGPPTGIRIKRPPLHPRPLLPRLRARPRLGRHPPRRPPRNPRPLRGPQGRPPRPHAPHGLHHRRGVRLLRARRRPRPPPRPTAPRAPPDRRPHRRELRALAHHRALRRPAPAGRSAPASPPTRCASPAPCRTAAPGSPAAARRSTSGPAAASPSWSTSPACPRAPSATSPPPPWWRRSSSPCPAPTTSPSAATPPRSAPSTTSCATGGEYTSGERRMPAPEAP